jgi:hypothetical protein
MAYNKKKKSAESKKGVERKKEGKKGRKSGECQERAEALSAFEITLVGKQA